MLDKLSRRDVIKTILLTSATSLIDNKVWAGKITGHVKAQSDGSPGIARVLLSGFPALNNNGGSVRLGSSGLRPDVTPVGLFYPIVINRISATEYVVLDTQCTHAGCVVNAFSGSVSTGRISCSCHGSQFDIRGNRTAGPANFPLLQYEATLASGVLTITLPDQGFDIQQTTVLNGAEKRLKLSWDSFGGVEYEVRWRPNFSTEPTRVNFFTTVSGATSVNVITGNDNPREVFVVPVDGIYQVAIKMRTV